MLFVLQNFIKEIKRNKLMVSLHFTRYCKFIHDGYMYNRINIQADHEIKIKEKVHRWLELPHLYVVDSRATTRKPSISLNKILLY